jgi:serine/threonine-protein kinase HipA
VRDKDGQLAIAKFPRKDDKIATVVWERVALPWLGEQAS